MFYIRVKQPREYQFAYIPRARIIRSMSGLAVRVRAFNQYWEFGWRELPVCRKTFSWARLVTGEHNNSFYNSKEWGLPRAPVGPPRCYKCGSILGKCLCKDPPYAR